MADEVQQTAVVTEETSTTPLTAEAISAIVEKKVNDGINAFVKSNKTDFAKLKSDFEAIKTATPVKTADGAITEPADQKYQVLERTVKELQDQNKAAVEKVAKADRDNALAKALSGYQFANEASRDIAHKVFSAEMATIGEGEYAIGDQPLADAVKSRMDQLTGLLAPKNVGGSGASTGNQTGQYKSSQEIKPGMTRDQMQAILNEAAKSLV